MALKARQIAELTAALEKRRKELIEEVRGDAAKVSGESYGELAGATPDTGDESVADLMADLGQADLGRDLGELRELEAARERLAAGTYGECIDCGSDIELERLRARPGAPRCITCQQRFEKTHAAARGGTL